MKLKTIIILSLFGCVFGGVVAYSVEKGIAIGAVIGFLFFLVMLLLMKTIARGIRRSCNKAQLCLCAIFIPLVSGLFLFGATYEEGGGDIFCVMLLLWSIPTFLFEFMLFSPSSSTKPKRIKGSFLQNVELNADADRAGEKPKQNVSGSAPNECPRCRLLSPPAATRCDCGYDFPTGSIQKSYVIGNEAVTQKLQLQEVLYGGFWRRVFAYLLDDMIINVGCGIFMLIFWVVLCPELILAIIVIRLTVLRWFYFAWLESSRHQATIGKQIFGLMVQREDGQTLSFARATGRYWSKLLSALPLLAGFVAVGLHHKKQGFHDLIAKTVVVQRIPDDNRIRNLSPWLLALIISILAILDGGFTYFNIPKFMPQCAPAQRLVAALLGVAMVYGWIVFLLVFIVKSVRNRKRQ